MGSYITYDDETKRLVDKLGHDIPVFWKDDCMDVGFITTPYNMLEGMCWINSLLACNDFISLDDFYNGIKQEYIEISSKIDPEMFAVGWNYMCFSNRDGPVLTIDVTSQFEDGDIIFYFRFNQPYCDCFCDPANCDCCSQNPQST